MRERVREGESERVGEGVRGCEMVRDGEVCGERCGVACLVANTGDGRLKELRRTRQGEEQPRDEDEA